MKSFPPPPTPISHSHFHLFHQTESVSYEFGAGRGLIQYQFPTGNQPDTEEDNIALGFVTVKTDAVLLRIESSNTQDYFELEIVRPPFPKPI